MKEKIHKVLARAGHGSRREIERWIQDGRVRVNGRPASLGMRVSTEDRVQVDGRQVSTRPPGTGKPRVIIYHKPEGEVCTRATDEKRPTVYQNLPPLTGARWVSVGRLDLNTSGLLMFTDDGELANRLMHPSSRVEREYLVRIRGKVDEDVISDLQAGVTLDGHRARFERVTRVGKRGDGQNQWFRVIICEGRYREVRRIWEKVGCQVSRLKRIRYGTVRLPRNLKQGQHARLAPAQLDKLLRKISALDTQQAAEGGSSAEEAPRSERSTARSQGRRRRPDRRH